MWIINCHLLMVHPMQEHYLALLSNVHVHLVYTSHLHFQNFNECTRVLNHQHVILILGIRMRKGLAHMVWWYFHWCAVLNFTDGVSGVNHPLVVGELSLLLYLAVSSALYVLPSVWDYVWTFSLVKRLARSWARSMHGVHVHVVCIDLASGMPRYIVLPLLSLAPRGCPPR